MKYLKIAFLFTILFISFIARKDKDNQQDQEVFDSGNFLPG
jgi:hypothetical protein